MTSETPTYAEFEEARGKSIYLYRVEALCDGFEPQLLWYIHDTTDVVWWPLAEDGYIADGDLFGGRRSHHRYPLATREAAALAILRAREKNGEDLIELIA